MSRTATLSPHSRATYEACCRRAPEGQEYHQWQFRSAITSHTSVEVETYYCQWCLERVYVEVTTLPAGYVPPKWARDLDFDAKPLNRDTESPR